MRVRTDSWHYRLLVWAEYPLPKGRCGYFWSVVFMATIGWLIYLVLIRYMDNDPTPKAPICGYVEYVVPVQPGQRGNDDA